MQPHPPRLLGVAFGLLVAPAIVAVMAAYAPFPGNGVRRFRKIEPRVFGDASLPLSRGQSFIFVDISDDSRDIPRIDGAYRVSLKQVSYELGMAQLLAKWSPGEWILVYDGTTSAIAARRIARKIRADLRIDEIAVYRARQFPSDQTPAH